MRQWLCERCLSSRYVDGDRSHLSAIEKRINLENRIFQAAYGAACNDPRPDRVGEYARLAMETLFDGDKVPENLLLQDCVRGLIQLAYSAGVLPSDFPIEKSNPPYGSRPPRFTVTRDQVEKLATQAGDRSILHSCNTWGDFGRYEIESVVRHFTASRLRSSAP